MDTMDKVFSRPTIESSGLSVPDCAHNIVKAGGNVRNSLFKMAAANIHTRLFIHSPQIGLSCHI